MRMSLVVAAAVLLACAAPAVAQAQCNLKSGQPAEVVGDVDEAWVSRTGTALYKVETDELTCDAEVAYLFDPRGTLLCKVGQHMRASGTYEPVTFDFTGSGYWVRVASIECR